MPSCAPFLYACLIPLAAAAAQTFVVDAANGPGAHFTSIAAAVAAVPDGAVLTVRAGNYAPFTIANKGMTILCAAGAIVTGPHPNTIVVSGTSALQSVSFRSLRTRSAIALAGSTLSLQNCQGPVLLEDCASAFGEPLYLQGTDCSRVLASNCRFGGNQINSGIGASFDNSVAVLVGCAISSGGQGGLGLATSSVQLVDCHVAVMQGYPSAPAVSMLGSDVRMVGGSCYTILNYSFAGTGSARIDPGVTLTGGFGGVVQSTIQTTALPMPAIVSAGGVLGGSVTATLRGPNGDAGALLVGLPGSPFVFPGIADAIWLQPGTESVCTFGVFSAGVPQQVTYQIPNSPAFRGVHLCWQGLSLGAANGLQTSNPSISSHW